MELTILMPCLNEAMTLESCIRKARDFLERTGIDGEVLVADNGSTDGSQNLAGKMGARVIQVAERGYGAALLGGINSARGRYVIMGDSDDSYDFSELEFFVDALRRGYQLVMGNRFDGGIEPGAMPFLHKYLGNPVLSFIGRFLFKAPVRDFHCGLRGFDRDAIRSLELNCRGMEFASEMVVKASLNSLKITEVPTTLSPDGRDRSPHLRTWRDGWRHLRFLLLLSPRWLFFYPGVGLLFLGFITQLMLVKSDIRFGSVVFDIHTMLYGASASIIGLQLTLFAILAKVFSVDRGLLPSSQKFDCVNKWVSLEKGVIIGSLCFFAGLLLSLGAVYAWDATGYGNFDPKHGMRVVIPAVCLMVSGGQLLFASFFYGLLSLGRPAERILYSSGYDVECYEDASA